MMEKSKKILQDWVNRDRAARGNLIEDSPEETDFDRFCEEKNKAIEKLLSHIKVLEEKIEIKDNYLDLIISIACDYDGCESPKQLKELIDEIVGYSCKALENVVNSIEFWGADDKYYNILHQEIKPKEGENENV